MAAARNSIVGEVLSEKNWLEEPYTLPRIDTNATILTHFNKALQIFIANSNRNNRNILIGIILLMHEGMYNNAIAKIKNHKNLISEENRTYIINRLNNIKTNRTHSSEIILARHMILTNYILTSDTNPQPFNISKLKPVNISFPNVSHPNFEYTKEFRSVFQIKQFIHNIFTNEVFSKEKNEHLKTPIENTNYAKLVDILKTVNDIHQTTKKPPHDTIEQLLLTNISLRNLYTVAEFISSYIDFHHDFLSVSYNLLQGVRKIFEDMILIHIGTQEIWTQKGMNTKITLKRWYEGWMITLETPLRGIYTGPANKNADVSQIRCRLHMNTLVDQLIAFISDLRNVEYIAIDWIPLTRITAQLGPTYNVKTGKKQYDKNVIDQLRNTLNTNGVIFTFVESLSNGFYSDFLLKLNETNTIGMENVTMSIAKWDAAPGYTRTSGINIETTDYNFLEPLAIFGGVANVAVVETVVQSAKKVEKVDILTCNFPNINNSENIIITGAQELSLNSILKMCKMPYIREIKEEDEDDEDDDKKDKVTELKGVEFSNPSITPLFTLLKTWTDFVQVRMLSCLNETDFKNKIAMCTVDICCDIRSRMYGIPYVMLTSKKNVTLSCYDLHANQTFIQAQQDQRILTLAYVIYNITPLKQYIEKWFNEQLRILTSIRKYSIDPALFFGISAINNSFNIYRNETIDQYIIIDTILNKLKTLSNMPPNHYDDSTFTYIFDIIQTFPTNLNEWFHRVTNTERITVDFDNTYNTIRNSMRNVQSHLQKVHPTKPSKNTMTSDQECMLYKEWNNIYQVIKQTIVNILPLNLNDNIRNICIICIFVIAYMENGDLTHILNMLITIQKAYMKNVMETVKIGIFTAVNFVTVDTMQTLFIPPISNIARTIPLEQKWEIRYIALVTAEKQIWKPARDLKGGNILKLHDAINIYHTILRKDTNFARFMKDTMLIGIILISMHSKQNNPFTFNIDKLNIPVSKQQPKRRKTYSNNESNNTSNNDTSNNDISENATSIYTFKEWSSLIRTQKLYTLSMIDYNATFKGLVDRVKKYINILLSYFKNDNTIPSPIMDLSSLITDNTRTRPLCDTNPRSGGIRRPKCEYPNSNSNSNPNPNSNPNSNPNPISNPNPNPISNPNPNSNPNSNPNPISNPVLTISPTSKKRLYNQQGKGYTHKKFDTKKCKKRKQRKHSTRRNTKK